MIHNDQNKFVQSVFNEFSKNGFDGMAEMFRIMLNEAMKVERENALQAQSYERTDERLGYANGFKPKTVATRIGNLDLQVPQVRGDISFYPSSLEKGLRSERALKVAMAEMYVQGISTRRVKNVFEKMCGVEVSSTQVSRAASLLDEELEKWRQRTIGAIVHLFLDARYEKVRVDGHVVSCAVLIAIGVAPDGKRTILGVDVSLSEAEIYWKKFLNSLSKRGMHGVESITSDAHEGLQNAIRSTMTGVPWQRCQFHLQQNAVKYVPKVAMREEVALDIRDIFNAPNLNEAERLLKMTVEKYEKSASSLSKWMDENLREGLTVFKFSRHKRKKLRTTNMVERQNKEIRRRTRVVSIFSSEKSLLRLVSALLMEKDEEWQGEDRRYIKTG